MIGSHNSGSFTEQKGITQFIPRCFSSCQKLTFGEQYNHGVRMFDLRVTFYKNDYYLAHGMVRYDFKLNDALHRIKNLGDDVIIGVMIEDTFLKFKGDVTEVSDILSSYKIPMCYYLYKSTSEKIDHVLIDDSRTVSWHIPTKQKGKLLVPKRDCKSINEQLDKSEMLKSNDIHIIDFVEKLNR